MTETVRWVTTPPCRSCAGRSELLRRPGCIGCEKLARKRPPQRAAYLPERPEKNLSEKVAVLLPAEKEREERNRRILALRDAGMSYGKIAGLLGIPRATAQSADTSARIARAEVDYTNSK